MMTYRWEWLSDLAIIPAFEIFLIGLMIGGVVIGFILRADRRKEIKVSNLQLIEALCNVVEQLVVVVKRLAGKLEQINALDEADREAVADAMELYAVTIGADETPDEYSQEDMKWNQE